MFNFSSVSEHAFNVFLRDHIETAFTKGFDDNSGRHMSPNLFEVMFDYSFMDAIVDKI